VNAGTYHQPASLFIGGLLHNSPNTATSPPTSLIGELLDTASLFSVRLPEVFSVLLPEAFSVLLPEVFSVLHQVLPEVFSVLLPEV
jgi:hypothetical protein